MSKGKKIAVVGAGLMGHGIAQIFATKGYDVALTDLRGELVSEAVEKIRSNLSFLANQGLGKAGEIEPAVSRIKKALNVKEAVCEAQFVVEAVFENRELKQSLFQELDSVCPEETILATNTSVISITEIAEKAKNRGRIVGTHFWNPPYLIPLVEVIRGRDTSDKTMDVTFELLEGVGKHPVRVNKDVPGFVGNRLQHALWREAISIVERGIADAATVDECIRFGFGLRLPVLGPLENADMVGLDLTLAIHDYILRHLESSPNPSPLLREKVQKGELGQKTGKGLQTWTDEETRHSRENFMDYLMKQIKERKLY